mmetsp:Transcript_77923/g.155978  ORF Transcript_77923/g.155978 Transcript_77923/m.155978 type:complete len:87 (-) Transcript_77923:48-308(-)
MRPLRAMPALGRSSVAIVGHDTKLGEMGFFSFLARHRRAPSVQMLIAGQQQATNNGNNRNKEGDNEIKKNTDTYTNKQRTAEIKAI